MITSTSSSQVKTVVSLQKKAKTRKETKQFVVEGMKMVSEVPQDRLVKVYFSESFAAANVSFLNKFAKEQTELVSDIVFAQMSDTKTPQGALAIVKMAQYTVQPVQPMHQNPCRLKKSLPNTAKPANGFTMRTEYIL